MSESSELQLMGLGGAKFTVKYQDHNDARQAVQHLMRCHGHHFAVIGDGFRIVVSHLGVECLRRAGLLPSNRAYVYEGSGHGE